MQGYMHFDPLGKGLPEVTNIITHQRMGQGGFYYEYGSTTQHAGSKRKQNAWSYNKRTV